MVRVHVNITTHKRPRHCLFLLQQIEKQSGGFDISVSVFHDRCDSDYSRVKEHCEKRGYDYIKTLRHYGKWRFWKLNNKMYRHIEKKDFDYYVQMPDDIILVDNFFGRLLPLVKNNGCINYMITNGAYDKFRQHPRKRAGGITLIETGWIDSAFCTTKGVMTGFRIKPNWRSRAKNPLKSSGVGLQQSAEYTRKTGRKAFSTRFSLCGEITPKSVMHSPAYNKRHRKRWGFEIVKKDVASIEAWRKMIASPVVLFYPDRLRGHSKINLALKALGIHHHNDKDARHDLSFFWSYNGTGAANGSFEGMVNSGCTDVSKTRVAKVFDDIIVDPETYRGPVVRKTENQCDRDETLVMCPAPREDGYIYRRLIDTREGDEYVDYRLYWFDGPKYMTKRYKHEALSKKYHRWEHVPLSLISSWKMAQITKGCKGFGFDYGEIDLLYDGRWYVIDLNNVAGTPQWFKNDKMLFELFVEHTKKFIYERIC